MPKLTLDEARRRKKVSKRALARRLKMDLSSLQRLLRSGANPTFATLVRLSKALGCRIRDLYRE